LHGQNASMKERSICRLDNQNALIDYLRYHDIDPNELATPTTRSVRQIFNILTSFKLAAYLKKNRIGHGGTCCIKFELELRLQSFMAQYVSAADQAIFRGLDANAGKQNPLFDIL
jgi:hypothetical protein